MHSTSGHAFPSLVTARGVQHWNTTSKQLPDDLLEIHLSYSPRISRPSVRRHNKLVAARRRAETIRVDRPFLFYFVHDDLTSCFRVESIKQYLVRSSVREKIVIHFGAV